MLIAVLVMLLSTIQKVPSIAVKELATSEIKKKEKSVKSTTEIGHFGLVGQTVIAIHDLSMLGSAQLSLEYRRPFWIV